MSGIPLIESVERLLHLRQNLHSVKDWHVDVQKHKWNRLSDLQYISVLNKRLQELREEIDDVLSVREKLQSIVHSDVFH